MAKKQNLSYQDIETSLEVLKERRIHSSEVGYVILKAFGKSDADIRRYREGKGILSTYKGLLIKGLFGYKPVTSTELTSTLESMKLDPKVIKAAPKIIAVSDGETILAYDMREKESYENPLARLYCDFAFFYPLCGVERFVSVGESPADVKAAEKLAKLHDELRAYNEFSSKSELHDLNIFIARLLFCFFAEDTGIFEDNLFTGSIVRYTKENGSDLADYLDAAFNVMDIKERNEDTMKIISQFPYVNGGLFSKHIQIPKMGYKARKIIIECGELNWQNINPDIFGSMIQAVVDPSVRANQGMHYTSVPNIMKVINPLFMDELREEYNKENEEYRQNKQLKEMGALSNKDFATKCQSIVKKSNALLSRMSKMKFFDPACGSGNFLIITYKSLRFLEMDILKLQQECEGEGNISAIMGSCINLRQFYGIELLDFPHEVAMLSLWLAQHQMDNKLFETFGVNTQALPLHNITQIQCGNACRLDWNVVCPHEKDDEVFVFGNPPYLGSALQESAHKSDMKFVFNSVCDGWKKLDYITAWFYLGHSFCKNNMASFAFVSTNSICQGEHIPIFWKLLLKSNLEISFAYHSFKWNNNAKGNAGVTCVIVGLRNKSNLPKYIFENENCNEVSNINPYLTSGESLIIEKRTKSIVGFSPMLKGCAAGDDGNFLLDKYEVDNLLSNYPQSLPLIKPILGSQEFIRGENRYCLWITDYLFKLASSISPIKDRIKKVYDFRIKSNRENTLKSSEFPYKFGEIRYKDSP
ncbi:MAG TPA: N-6 DNA methylase, partial [Xylanibacter oryzae]|nr:N-6 DNA methylase [Xylanibacter oryzae]